MIYRNFPFILLFIPLLLSLGGCSRQALNNTEQLQTTNKSVSVMELKSLKSISDIASTLASRRVVFVGEQHDQLGDHLNQLEVIKNLHKIWKENTVIGLEMIQQPYQPFLNDYISGKINEKAMLQGVEWYDRWRYDFRLYRPIFEYARKHKIPLVGLNVPSELTKQITKVGINGLGKNGRLMLPNNIDRSNKKYINRITKVFGQHSHTSSKGVEKFIDAQLAWDEGMAFSSAKYLKKNPNARMIILAGGGHIINRSGIPDRLDRMLGSRSAVILNNINGTLSPEQGDYILFSPDVSLSPAGKIGIIMGKSKEGVLVNGVSPHSAAVKAGIKKGDLLISIDRAEIKSQSDVLLWGLDKKPNDIAMLKLMRNKNIITKKIVLKSNSLLRKH